MPRSPYYIVTGHDLVAGAYVRFSDLANCIEGDKEKNRDWLEKMDIENLSSQSALTPAGFLLQYDPLQHTFIFVNDPWVGYLVVRNKDHQISWDGWCRPAGQEPWISQSDFVELWSNSTRTLVQRSIKKHSAATKAILHEIDRDSIEDHVDESSSHDVAFRRKRLRPCPSFNATRPDNSTPHLISTVPNAPNADLLQFIANLSNPSSCVLED